VGLPSSVLFISWPTSSFYRPRWGLATCSFLKKELLCRGKIERSTLVRLHLSVYASVIWVSLIVLFMAGGVGGEESRHHHWCDGTSQVIRPTYSCPCLTDIRHPVDVPKSLDKFGIFPYLSRNVSPVLQTLQNIGDKEMWKLLHKLTFI
jgi:hypothetical protein